MRRVHIAVLCAALGATLAACSAGSTSTAGNPSCNTACQSAASSIAASQAEASQYAAQESETADPVDPGDDTLPTDTDTDPADTAVAFGQPQYLVEGASAATVTVSKVAKPNYADYTPQGYYFVLSVKVECTAGTWNVNPLYLEAVGTDGQQYDDDIGIVADDLDSTTLNAGHYVTGDVAFKGTKSTTYSEVDYTDEFGATVAVWH